MPLCLLEFTCVFCFRFLCLFFSTVLIYFFHTHVCSIFCPFFVLKFKFFMFQDWETRSRSSSLPSPAPQAPNLAPASQLPMFNSCVPGVNAFHSNMQAMLAYSQEQARFYFRKLVIYERALYQLAQYKLQGTGLAAEALASNAPNENLQVYNQLTSAACILPGDSNLWSLPIEELKLGLVSQQSRLIQCADFKIGKCNRGVRCEYSHAESSQRSNAADKKFVAVDSASSAVCTSSDSTNGDRHADSYSTKKCGSRKRGRRGASPDPTSLSASPFLSAPTPSATPSPSSANSNKKSKLSPS
jgi:hypothetical protein